MVNQQLIDGLCGLRTNYELIDITLVAEGVKFPCHRVVLAATSAYFRAMFLSDLSERSQSEVELSLVDASSLSAIVDYMYTGKIDIYEDNVQNIFSVSSLLNMPQVQLLCGDYMCNELHLANCLGIFEFASFHHCKSLEIKALEFCCRHFELLVLHQHEDLMNLGLQELVKLISNDDLNVRREDTIVKLIIQWVEFNVNEREQFVVDLGQCIRWALISEPADKLIRNSNVFMSNDRFCELLTEHLIEEENNTKDIVLRYGMYAANMLVFVAGGLSRSSRSLGSFDPETKKSYWALPMHSTFDFKDKIDHHRAVVTKHNEIFVSGGVMYDDYINNSHQSALREMRWYDPYKKEWEDRPAMLSGRCSHAFVAVSRFLFVLGGKKYFPHGEPLNTVERFSIEENTWHRVSSMPTALYHHSAVAYRDKIIVLGGITTDVLEDQYANKNVLRRSSCSLHGEEDIDLDLDEEFVTNLCFEYDTHTDSWTRIQTPMLSPRCEFGATICQDKIYVVGGSNGQLKLNSVEVLDIRLLFEKLDCTASNERYLKSKSNNCNENFDEKTEIGTEDRNDSKGTEDVFLNNSQSEAAALSKSQAVMHNKKLKWHYVSDFPEDRKCGTAVTLSENDNGFYLCGGVRSIISRQDQSPRVVEARDLWRYDCAEDSWKQQDRLIQSANIHACVVASMNVKNLNPSGIIGSNSLRTRIHHQRSSTNNNL